MFNKVISFGCSWTYGDEIIDPSFEEKYNHPVMPHDSENNSYRNAHCFAGLVAKHYAAEFIQMAFPGGSLQSMIWNFNWWLSNTSDKDKAETLVLVGLTEESRISWFNPYYQTHSNENKIPFRYMHSTWLKEDIDIKDEPYQDEWRKMLKLYNSLSESSETRKMNYEQTVRQFDGAAARYDIPMIQFNVLASQREPKLPTLLDSSSALEMLVVRDKPRKEPLFMPKKHPNEKGHQIISEFLISKIDDVIINA